MDDEKFNEIGRKVHTTAEMHKLLIEQEWHDILAGHRSAVKKITGLLKSDEITPDEARALIQYATTAAIRSSTVESLYKSGSISERTYRMITGQSGSFEPLK